MNFHYLLILVVFRCSLLLDDIAAGLTTWRKSVNGSPGNKTHFFCVFRKSLSCTECLHINHNSTQERWPDLNGITAQVQYYYSRILMWCTFLNINVLFSVLTVMNMAFNKKTIYWKIGLV